MKREDFTEDEYWELVYRLANGLILWYGQHEFAMGTAQQIIEYQIFKDTKPRRNYRELMAKWFAKKYPHSVNHWLEELPWMKLELPYIKYEPLPPGHPDHSCMYLKEICDDCERRGIQPS